MGIFDWIKGTWSRTTNVIIGGENMIHNESPVGYYDLLNIPSVYSSIELISNTVAGLEIKLYSEDGATVGEVKDDSRLFCFNDEPNGIMTGGELKKAIVRDYLIYGNAYIYIKRTQDKIDLVYVPSNRVSVFEDTTDPVDPVVKLNVGGKEYYPHEFIILTKNTLIGGRGYGILQECQELLQLAITQNHFTRRLLLNGGVKRALLQATRPLSEDALKQLRERFDEVYSGKKNTVVLNDNVKHSELQQSSQEIELVQLQSSINDAILTVFDIPKNLYNNNIPTEIWQMFIKSAINPILTKIEQALNKALLTKNEKGKFYFAFDTKQLMKGDISKRFDAYEIAVKNGFMTRNEIRFEEDLAKLDGLDNVVLSLGEVLLNTQTGDIYTPNTGLHTNSNDLKPREEVERDVDTRV